MSTELVLQTLPEQLVKTLKDVHGSAGESWLADLPQLLNWVVEHWQLTLAPVKHALSYNLVLPVQDQRGCSKILKLGVPNREIETEINALQYYQGPGVVTLHRSDVQRGLLLLEALEPGAPLSNLDSEDAQLQILCETIQCLHAPRLLSLPPLPSLADWYLGFQRLRQAYQGGTGPFSHELVTEAEACYQTLLRRTQQQVVLHGDLHPGNILQASATDWIAIDPKGILGDPVFEVISFLDNHIPTRADPEASILRCSEKLSQMLGYSLAHILAWGFAKTVLSAIWFWEDHGEGWEKTIRLAASFHKLTKIHPMTSDGKYIE